MKQLFLLEDDLSLINGLSFALSCPHHFGSECIMGKRRI